MPQIAGLKKDQPLVEQLQIKVAHYQALSHEQREELRRLRIQTGRAEKDADEARKLLGLVQSIQANQTKPPKWTLPKRRAKGHRATPTLMLSDLHFDEVVKPQELQGYNAYSRDIAEMRLRKTADSTLEILGSYMQGLTWDGFVLVLGGDLLSGDIHQELAKTNEAPWADGVVHWSKQLVSFINLLKEELKVPIHIPCVVGNHDRNPMNRRTPAKQRAMDSLSWIMYCWIADRFSDDDMVTVQVAEGMDLRYDLYTTKMLLTHGDQFKGGHGIGGVYMPISRGAYKKSQQYQAMGDPFDHMVLGHFHQLIQSRQFTVNGSLKGYDEYAQSMAFLPEPPAQALWITTPERGITAQYPVYPASPKAEGWGLKDRV